MLCRAALVHDSHLYGVVINSMQERLALEQKYAAWNRLKIQNTWRKIMRLAKVRQGRLPVAFCASLPAPST